MLDNSITDWISSISSVFLVGIAFYANKTWREEIKQKKEKNIIEKIYSAAKKIEEFIIYDENYIEHQKTTHSFLHGLRDELSLILFEYRLIKSKKEKKRKGQAKTIEEYIEYFINFTNNYLNSKCEFPNFKFDNIDEFWEDFTPVSSDEDGNVEYTDKHEEVAKHIQLIKKECEDKIKNFYNPSFLNF